MTLHQAIALVIGDSRGINRGPGSSPGNPRPHDLATEDLALDCPLCRLPVPYPGRVRDGATALAECDSCDLYFDFAPHEVYTPTAATTPPDRDDGQAPATLPTTEARHS